MPTKLALVHKAYEEVGLPPYNFTISPEALESARERLDAMVASWMERGLMLGYNLGGSTESESGLALTDVAAAYLNLAIAIAPGLGKTPATETKQAAATALDSLWTRAAYPPDRQPPPELPRGEGQRPWRSIYRPFMPPPDFSPLRAPQTDSLTLKKE